MGFYTFKQNNSGGWFQEDENAGISIYVIVEGDTMAEIISTAREIGIYFDGCSTGQDCDCCGDRWYEPWNKDELDEEPMIYDTPYREFGKSKEDGFKPIKWAKGAEGYIHYASGTVEEILTEPFVR